MRPVRILAPALGIVACASLAVVACAGEQGAEPNAAPDAATSLPSLDGDLEDAAPSCDVCAPVDCTAEDFCSVAVPSSPLVSLNAVWGTSAHDLWAVGTRGTILHYDGTAFTLVPSGTDAVLFSVSGTASDDVWIATASTPLHSTKRVDGTLAWETVKGESWAGAWMEQGRIWSVFAPSKDDVWLGGSPSQRFGAVGSLWTNQETAEGGIAWTAVDAYDFGSFALPTIRAIWGVGPTDLWAVGLDGVVFRYEGPSDGGPARWTDRNSLASTALHAIWGTSATDVWAVGEDGAIRHLADDPTETFAEVPSPTSHTLNAVWGSGASDVWAVGDRGTILHYDGSAWTAARAGLPSGFTPDLFGIWGSGPDDVWIVGEGVVLHRTANNRRRR